MILTEFEKKASEILSVVGNPFRIRILLEIGNGEVCVCHLEKILKKRQAYISQHLMALRSAGLLTTRREGKYIFYRLANREIINLIRDAGLISGLNQNQLPQLKHPRFVKNCICPSCENNNEYNMKSTVSNTVNE